MTARQTAHSFVEAINCRDLYRISGLMTEDHAFIEADGSQHRGRDVIRELWGQYFAMVPDYRIQIHQTLSQGSSVALFGTAEGTFAQKGVLKPENRWAVPAAWRVVVEGDRVAVWQLYVNPGPMIEILNRLKDK